MLGILTSHKRYGWNKLVVWETIFKVHRVTRPTYVSESHSLPFFLHFCLRAVWYLLICLSVSGVLLSLGTLDTETSQECWVTTEHCVITPPSPHFTHSHTHLHPRDFFLCSISISILLRLFGGDKRVLSLDLPW